MKLMRLPLVGLCILCGLGFATPSLAVPDMTFSLNKYVGSGTPPAEPYGAVELTTNGSNVDVLVTLAALSGFVNTGAGDWLFFNLSNFLLNPTTINPAISITNIATPGNGSGLSWHTASLSGSTLNLMHSGGAGDWELGVFCLTGCFNGGSRPDAGPLSFTVTNVTVANFIPNASGYYFSADLCVSGFPVGRGCGGANVTGNAVATGGTPTATTITGVPEPATIALFGIGLLGAAMMAARRRRTVPV